jgi:Type I restriction enzyme R protein N terminus (HSDR_N)
MTQTVQARELTLGQLEENFGLLRSTAGTLFAEDTLKLPNLTPAEKDLLNQVKAEFTYMSSQDVLEPIVKMVVLSTLLRIAGFFRAPFRITAEKQVELVTEDEGLLVRGLIDLLVFYDQIWVVTIEAKRAEYSLKAAITQVLTYMLASPSPQKQVYGLVTNGSEFRFIELLKQDRPSYVLSDLFAIDRGDDFDRVAQILKYLGQQVLGNELIQTKT